MKIALCAAAFAAVIAAGPAAAAELDEIPNDAGFIVAGSRQANGTGIVRVRADHRFVASGGQFGVEAVVVAGAVAVGFARHVVEPLPVGRFTGGPGVEVGGGEPSHEVEFGERVRVGRDGGEPVVAEADQPGEEVEEAVVRAAARTRPRW